MFFHTTYLRRMTGFLAISLSLLGGLQQAHAFCFWTECQSKCCEAACCPDCPCAGDGGQAYGVAGESTAADSCLGDQHDAPCQQECWCCQPLAPSYVFKDRIEGAKVKFTEGTLPSANDLYGGALDRVVSRFTADAWREALIPTSAQRCVQLCRFRI